MAKAQGSLEYLVIIVTVLAVSSVVVLYVSGILGGQTSNISVSSCKQAAIDCKGAKMLSPNDPCSSCQTACADLNGNELFEGAVYCCNHAEADMIYENSPGCGGGYSTSKCSDGTVKMTCSETKPLFCDMNLDLVSKCTTCYCPDGYSCNATTNDCYLSCNDGTVRGQCSATPNTFCTSSGTLVTDCIQCPPCPTGQTCNPTSRTCYLSCSDGTPYNTCSATPGIYCNASGTLVTDCVQCPTCPTGYSCNPTSKLCYESCSDGTPYGGCSLVLPLYCSSGTLVNNCTTCSCPSGQACNSTNQACYVPLVRVELFYDEFSSMIAWTGQIRPDGWHANLTNGYNNSNSAVDYNYSTQNITHVQSTVGAIKINVSFWAKNDLYDKGEVMRFEWFNGTNWTSMGNLPNNHVWTYYSYALPASAEGKPNFAIRFLCYDWHYQGYTSPEDACWVDTVRITAYIAGCPDGTPLGKCTSTPPQYCTPNGQLVDNCSECGCPPNSNKFLCCCDVESAGLCQLVYNCKASGSCSSSVEMTDCTPCSTRCCVNKRCTTPDFCWL